MPLKSYTLSALSVLTIVLISRVAGAIADDRAILALFIAVVSLCGWFGNVRLSLFAAWVGTATVAFYFLYRGPTEVLSTSQLGRISTFLAIGIQCSLVFAFMWSAWHKANEFKRASSAVRSSRETDLQTASILRATEKHFHRLASALPQVLWSSPPDGRPDYCNRTYYEKFGFSESTVLTNAALLATIHPNDFECYRSAWSASLESGQPGSIEYRLKSPSGDGFRWNVGRFLPVRDSEGRIERWFSTSIDVDDRKRAEEQLEATRQQLEKARQAAFEELELRVRERTADLTRVNAALSEEIQVRIAAESARNALQQRLAAAQENERSRIARELHDQMGQSLTAMGIGLHALGATIPASPQLHQLQVLTEKMSREVQRIALELRPAVLDDLGLNAAVLNYLEEWGARSDIEINFLERGFDANRLANSVETTAYRVIQEALTNAYRHAAARRVSVVLQKTTEHLQVVVEDDGRGFDVSAVTSSPDIGSRLGLLGMEERVLQAGGILSIESTPGKGTGVVTRIPLKPHERTD